MSAADLIEKRTASLPTAKLVRRPSFDEVCTLAAERTAELLVEAVASRGSGHLALTGGSAGIALARSLPATFAAAGISGSLLENVHLWFGDERFVAAGDPDRNDLLVAGLVDAGLPDANVHRVRGPELVAGVDAAAAHLAEELSATGPAEGRFDVVHLGVGPDAHVCSLFPGHPAALLTGGRRRRGALLPQASARAGLTDLRCAAPLPVRHGGSRRCGKGGGGSCRPGSA